MVHAALNKKIFDAGGRYRRHFGSLPIHIALDGSFDGTNHFDGTRRNALPGAGPELVRAILDAGGDAMLRIENRDGLGDRKLPLHVAAEYSWSPAVIKLLLARGPTRPKYGPNIEYLGQAQRNEMHRAPDCARHNKGPAAEEIKALLRAAMW